MAKAAYRSNSTKGGTTPYRLQTTVQKMAPIEKRLQVVVQHAEPRAEVYAEKIAEMDDAESCADFRAVIRAELRAVVRAESRAEHDAEMIAAPAGRPVYSEQRHSLPCSSGGATCRENERITPTELQNRIDTLCRNELQKRCREIGAVCRYLCRTPCSSSCNKK